MINYNEVKKLITEGKFSQARELLEKLIENGEETTEALNLLAFTYLQLGNFSKSIAALEKTAQLNPDSSAPLVNLGIIYNKKGELEKSVKYFARAEQIEPENPLAVYNYALALAELGEIHKAIEKYKRTIELEPKHYDALHNLSMLYLLNENCKEGWELFEYRFFTNELKRKEMPGTRWRGEDAKDKTLYVYSDQGFGDAIQFARMLKYARPKVKEIIFEVQIELLGLFKKFKYIDRVVPTRPDFSATAKYDLQIPLMSLPHTLGINKKNASFDFPYIFPDNEKSERWKALLDVPGKIKVGVAWRGNPVYAKNHIRSADVKHFKEIFKTRNAVFFSLQKDAYEREREFLMENEVADLSEYLSDFSETAAIMQNLDLIISTDTVIPHLAGAMAKPVFTLLSKIPDWRWGLNKSYTEWYPTMKLFRQTKTGDWKSVFVEAKKELEEFINKKPRIH